MKRIAILIGAVALAGVSASAHVGVKPTQSTAGASETYTFRVPSERGLTTTGVFLQVPDEVIIASVSEAKGATHQERRTGDRIIEVSWNIEIKPGERAELSVLATNSTSASLIAWKVIQKYSNGSSSEWVGAPGDRSPAPVTKLVAGTGDLKAPASADEILRVIHGHRNELADIISSKKLVQVHQLAFAIRDLANMLPSKASAEKRTQVEGSVKNLARLAEDLDQSGDSSDQMKTESNLKKLDGLLKLLDTQFDYKR